MGAHLPRVILDRLEAANTVRIETRARPGTGEGTRRTTIWIVVVDDEVYVRSVRGTRGRWYRDLQADPLGAVATRGPAGPPIPVRAIPSPDVASVERCSAGLTRKYGGDPALGSMLRPETLETTMRLETATPGEAG